MRSVSFAPAIKFDYSMDEAFPSVEPGFAPFGSRVVVQMRTSKKQTSGMILLADDTRDTIKWNTQVGKVVALGPLAFKSRSDMKEWPESAWCKVGEFVRTPKFGGDKFEIEVPGQDEMALFAIFNDLDLIGKYSGDPRDVLAFI